MNLREEAAKQEVFSSGKPLTRQDFEDMLDYMEWINVRDCHFYDLVQLYMYSESGRHIPFGFDKIRQTSIRRRYFKAFGQHYMNFKDQWYSYNPKNGRTTKIDKPEFAHDL